jgi:hypothetical protein
VSKKWFTAALRCCMRRASLLALYMAPVVLLHFRHAGAGCPVIATATEDSLCGRLYRLVCHIGSRVGCLQAVFVCCVDMSGRWLCVVWALVGYIPKAVRKCDVGTITRRPLLRTGTPVATYPVLL